MADNNSVYINSILQAAADSGFTPVLGQLIVAQAQVESANFSSPVFNSCANCFGYKYVGQDNATDCTASNDGGDYAGYASVYDSAMEICNWLKRNVTNYNSLQTPADYASAIKNSKIGSYMGAPTSQYAMDMAYYFSLPSIGAFVNKNPVASILIIIGAAASLSVGVYFLVKKIKTKG